MIKGGYAGKPIPRSVYLLLMLYANNGTPIKGKIRLEKMIFLLDQLIRRKHLHIADKLYDFRAYSYGPFSEDVYDDVELLKDLGLLRKEGSEENPSYEITEKGKTLIEKMIEKGVMPESLLGEVERIKRRWNCVDLYSLLRYIYENYKEYTQKSLIRSRFR